jgi:molybdenum cofactor cytidylyltransferase
MAASLKAGIAALPLEADAVLVCLGDMPLVTAALIDRLIGAYRSQPAPCIVVPTCHGQRGNPVLWDRAYFADMVVLAGDAGARGLLTRHAAQVTEVETGDHAVLTDFDTPESFAHRA